MQQTNNRRFIEASWSKHKKDYQVFDKIGNGSYGTVYDCQEKDSQEKLVIKIIRRQSASVTTREISIMEILKRKVGFPKIIDWGMGRNGHEFYDR